MGHLKHHFDIADNEIKPGDFVVYAALWDRSATLKYGIVTRLAEREEPGYMRSEDEKYTVRVLSVDRSSRWEGDPDGLESDRRRITIWELQKNGKEVALGFLDRMLVVPSSQVPSQARAVLQDALRRRTK